MEDLGIGTRALYELTNYIYSTGNNVTAWCKENGINKGTVYAWKRKGYTPNAWILQKMAFMGLDVVYILTGRRSNGVSD